MIKSLILLFFVTSLFTKTEIKKTKNIETAGNRTIKIIFFFSSLPAVLLLAECTASDARRPISNGVNVRMSYEI